MSASSFKLTDIYSHKNLRLIESMFSCLEDGEKDVILVLRDVRRLMFKYDVAYSGIAIFNFESIVSDGESEEYAQAITSCLLQLIDPAFRFTHKDIEAIEFYHFCKMIAKKKSRAQD